jgi:hypothetical protein
MKSMNDGWRIEFMLTLPKNKVFDVQELLNTLKLNKACGFDGIPNECLRNLPRKSSVHITQFLTIAFGCPIFRNLGSN